jgi:hypothetical protein
MLYLRQDHKLIDKTRNPSLHNHTTGCYLSHRGNEVHKQVSRNNLAIFEVTESTITGATFIHLRTLDHMEKTIQFAI